MSAPPAAGASPRRAGPRQGMPPRLSRLPGIALPAAPGLDVRVATTARARLLGLAGLRALPSGAALLLPRTRSVHTLGMRFALDLVWLDARGVVVRRDLGVGPGRLRRCAAARAVLERAARA